MTANKEIVHLLKDKIVDVLGSKIEGDVIIVDAPYYKNIGDVLIWEGEIQFLHEKGCNLLGSYSSHTFLFPDIDSKTTILFNGGGNLGDIYPEHMVFLKKIINKYPNNKIIVFPQTVHYNNKKSLEKDMQELSLHKNMFFCTRDVVSRNNVMQFLGENRVACLPDMAFCIDLTPYIPSQPDKSNGDMLYIHRTDCEVSTGELPTIPNNAGTIYTADWPTFTSYFGKSYIFNTVLDRMYRFIPFSDKWLGSLWDTYAMNVFRVNMIKEGINFIKNYDIVQSERLHGAILAILLGKKVIIVDNSYGKNSSFYNTWLKEFDQISLLSK